MQFSRLSFSFFVVLFTSVLLSGISSSDPDGPPRIRAQLPSPKTHPFFHRHTTQPPELTAYSPPDASRDCFRPGFAAIRGLNMVAPETWAPLLDQYLNATDKVRVKFTTVCVCAV